MQNLKSFVNFMHYGVVCIIKLCKYQGFTVLNFKTLHNFLLVAKAPLTIYII